MKTTVRYDVFWFELIFTTLWGGFAFTNLHNVTDFMCGLAYVCYFVTGAVMFIGGTFILVNQKLFYPASKLNNTTKLFMIAKFIVVTSLFFTINCLPMIYRNHFGVGDFAYKYLTGLLIIKIIFFVELIVFLLIPILSQKSKKE